MGLLRHSIDLSGKAQVSEPLAGQMAVQGNVGGGSFVCGLKRVLSEYHSLDFQGAVGDPPSLAPA